MNDVVLDTNKIHQYLPEFRKSKKDRAYRYEEIHRLLDVADERMRAIIFLLASTGMRIGAIPGLRLRDLEKVESDYDIYKITVYEGLMKNTLLFAQLNVPAKLMNT
jgi:integrase